MSAGKSGSLGSQPTGGTERDSSEADVANLDDIGKTSRSDGAELTKGEIFDLLKNRRRRMVIHFLRENDGESVLNDLAEHIAAEENDTTVRQLSSDQRKRVYIGLYQCHLPKMDSLGVIDYDKNRGTIELQASVAQLLEYMDLDEDDREDAEETERTWAVPAVAGCVTVLVTAGAVGLGPLAAVPAATWTLLSVVGILAIVALQYAG
ncbi:hypothetical protein DJ81_03535 [Halorubrum sp. Hd13]|nr:hypothetical protein DJ81_03535 [Halorubrum sp. Hd13]OYR48869.1 hypothetical protein DJ75_01955 [Halorubrum sp. Eb13]